MERYWAKNPPLHRVMAMIAMGLGVKVAPDAADEPWEEATMSEAEYAKMIFEAQQEWDLKNGRE